MNPSTDDLPKVTPRSKKEDILAAYEELAQKLTKNVEQSSEEKVTKERTKEAEVIKKAGSQSGEAILKNIAELETILRKNLSDLAQALLNEYEKLTELQKAATYEQKYLEEMHQIKVEAETLAGLIQAHKEKKRQLEEEYTAYERQLTQEQERQREDWERQEAEYQYDVKVRRKKEEAEYEEKKVAREKVLKEREEKMKLVEEEFAELKKMKAMFDQTLHDEMARVGQETEERVRREEEIKATLLAEKVLADKRVSDLTIGALRKELADKDSDIKRLKEELEIANRGVKDIAIKVIEGQRPSEEHRTLREERSGARVEARG